MISIATRGELGCGATVTSTDAASDDVKTVRALDRLQINVRGGDRQQMNVWGGDCQQMNVRGGDRQQMNVRGGDRLQMNARGGDGQQINVRGGDGQQINVRGGDRQQMNARGGDCQQMNVRGGDRQQMNVWGGDCQQMNVRGGDRQQMNVRGGDRLQMNARGGDGQQINVRDGDRLQMNVRGGDGQQMNVVHRRTAKACHSVVEDGLHELNKQMHRAEQCVKHQAELLWEAGSDFLHHHQLPEWLRDNEYLLSGHRPQIQCVWTCLKSMFSIHAETCNIWTHGLGCLMFLWFLWNDVTHEGNDAEERLLFGILHGSVALCLLGSWTNHTFCCHSPTAYKALGRLDFAGIATMIMGSFIAWIHYVLYCHRSLLLIYLPAIVLLGIGIVGICQIEPFASPEYRTLRTGLYAMYALCGVVPASHYLLYYANLDEELAFFAWFAVMAANFLLAGAIYVLRVPECYSPGKYDIWFNSHQIMHVLIITGGLIQYYGVTKVANYRLHQATCSTS